VWKFEVYAGSSGQYNWRLFADNGQNVASSGESFASKANADRAAEGFKANAGQKPTAPDRQHGVPPSASFDLSADRDGEEAEQHCAKNPCERDRPPPSDGHAVLLDVPTGNRGPHRIEDD
jgi:uncharacterized protein YegP (UPF0339 family)